MAWLVAFNDGLFNDVEPEAIPGMLEILTKSVISSPLGLDAPREEWSSAVSEYLPKQVAGRIER
jgi:F-type H+-transporting ATPase subunit alpha